MNAQTSIEAAPPAVYAAIAAFMCQMSKEGISKQRRSGDGGGPKFAFRGIDDVYNALAPVLAANQLMMLPRMLSRFQEERQTRNGGVMFYTTVEAEFDIVSGVDGSRHTVRTFGEAMDSSDKSTNKAMSAAFKYAAMQAFCIPTEGDNDADASTHEVQAVAKQERRTERQADAPKDDDGLMPDAEWANLSNLLRAANVPASDLIAEYGVRNLRHINMDQYANAIERLNTILADRNRAESNERAKREEAKQPANEFGGAAEDCPF